MIRAFLCLSSLALPFAISACTSSADYPSLARRGAERITGTADVVSPAPAPSPLSVPPRPELAARLSQLVEQARDAHQRFASRRGAAERLISAASGAAIASESWSLGNVALADLEATRSEAIVALATLDELYAAESVKAAEIGDMGKADAAADAHQQVNTWVAEEDEVLGRLRGKL